MEVASLSPVPVGVLSWNSPDPCVTVVVKATFDIEADGSVSLVPDQPALCLDLATPIDDRRQLGLHGAELYYGTDFAPRKGAVDVLAVGHARSERASRRIPFRLRIGLLDLTLFAVTDQPTQLVPLSERFVRRDPDDAATAVRLAPANSSVMGWISRTVAPGFDFGVFNTAPREHRLKGLSADAQIHTEGMLRRGDRTIQLAGVAPRVFHVEDRGATHPGEPVPMVCDTLWIDTDREHITLVWRGQVARSRPGERPFVVVKLHGAGEVTWSDMSRRLSRAAWLDATEPHNLRHASEAPAMSQSEPTLTALRTLDAFDSPESTTARLAKRLRQESGFGRGPDSPRPRAHRHQALPPLADVTLVDSENALPAKPAWRRVGGGTVVVDDEDVATLSDASSTSPPSAPIPLAPLSESAVPIPLAPSTIRRPDDDS